MTIRRSLTLFPHRQIVFFKPIFPAISCFMPRAGASHPPSDTHAFDLIAKHRKVFKVETITDSRTLQFVVFQKKRRNPLHLNNLIRSDCLSNSPASTNKLEEKLAPGTAALGLRVTCTGEYVK
jgi:hypothetical protein